MQAKANYGYPMYKAVIFDMDGVIMDSVALHFEAFRRFFQSHGVPLSREQLLRYNGPSTREILQTVKEEHGLSYAIEEALAGHAAMAAELLPQMQPFPDARQTV